MLENDGRKGSVQSLNFRNVPLLLLFTGIVLPLILSTVAGSNSEIEFLRYLHTHSSPSLDSLAVFITNLGGIKASLIYGAVLALFAASQKDKQATFFIILAVGGAGMINALAKLTFHRNRPSAWETLVIEESYSFPSGHAMASMAFALTLVYLMWNCRARVITIMFCTSYVVVISTTRLYLGVHFPSDILAGWCLSFAWVMGVRLIVQRIVLH